MAAQVPKRRPSAPARSEKRQGSGEAAPAALPETLVREFNEMGLSPYEARVLLALLRLGAANSLQLSRLSGVPRTSIYQVLESLAAKHLAQRVPAEGPAVWAAPGRDEVLERLDLAQEERLRQHRLRTARVREALAEAFPEGAEVPVPYVHLLHGTAQVARAFEQLWDDVRSEVLAFSRPPYSTGQGHVVAPVLEALDRGVAVRALYETAAVEEASKVFRDEIDAYVEAGVQARVVDQLPIKLVVFDRRSVLIALTGPVVEIGYPTNLLIEHSGFAEVQADSFERRWETAREYLCRAGAGVERIDDEEAS